MVLTYRRLLHPLEEAMHDLLEEETTARLTKERGVASSGLPFTLNVAATVVKAVGFLDGEDLVDVVEMVNAADLGTAMKVSAPIANWQLYNRYMQKAEMCSGGRKQRWADLFPVRGPGTRRSRLHLLQMCNGVVESKESHNYTRSRYIWRLRSLLTNCLRSCCCCHHRCSKVGHSCWSITPHV